MSQHALRNQKVRVTGFIAVIWNRTCNISEVGLYLIRHQQRRTGWDILITTIQTQEHEIRRKEESTPRPGQLTTQNPFPNVQVACILLPAFPLQRKHFSGSQLETAPAPHCIGNVSFPNCVCQTVARSMQQTCLVPTRGQVQSHHIFSASFRGREVGERKEGGGIVWGWKERKKTAI
jgi:hypothetical protein